MNKWTGRLLTQLSPICNCAGTSEPDKDFMQWLAQKPAEWLQQFYALLHDETLQHGIHRLRRLKIVRLNGSNHRGVNQNWRGPLTAIARTVNQFFSSVWPLFAEDRVTREVGIAAGLKKYFVQWPNVPRHCRSLLRSRQIILFHRAKHY